jgi:hypothetical protein
MNLTECPTCEQEVRVPSALLGQRVRCPCCDGVFQAPRLTVEVVHVIPRPTPPPPPPQREVRRPRRFCCPYCYSQEWPRERSRITNSGWIIFGLLLFCFPPLCWLGILLRETYPVCRGCGAALR